MSLNVAQAMYITVTEGEVTHIANTGEVYQLTKNGSGFTVQNEDGTKFSIFPHFSKFQATTPDGAVEDVYDAECSLSTICEDFFENILEMGY